MNLREVLQFRRSVRIYDRTQKLDTQKVKACIELATLAPNSSNMQLWEFYHATSPKVLEKLAVACMGQSAATTADQMVVFVTRRDLFRKRARAALVFEKNNIALNSPEDRVLKRMNDQETYYGKIMPFLYARFFGLLGLLRKLIVWSIGIFRPVVYQVSENDMKVVVHKSCGLAAQTFMIAMANEGYDTCPMEGFDSKRVKRILNLPYSAEINMVISCGIRKGNLGIRGDRFRVPFEEVYTEV
ncbi:MULTISPECIES: nitroreductase family protein [Chitinophagaceae]